MRKERNRRIHEFVQGHTTGLVTCACLAGWLAGLWVRTFYFPKEVTKLNQGSHQGKVNMKNQLNLTSYFKFTVKHLGHKKDILNEHPYPFSLKNKNLC